MNYLINNLPNIEINKNYFRKKIKFRNILKLLPILYVKYMGNYLLIKLSNMEIYKNHFRNKIKFENLLSKIYMTSRNKLEKAKILQKTRFRPLHQFYILSLSCPEPTYLMDLGHDGPATHPLDCPSRCAKPV